MSQALPKKITLGDFELIHLSDGTYKQDAGSFFGVVPKVLWQKKARADEQNFLPSGLNSVLVRTGDKNVLIETGIGNKHDEKKRSIWGHQELLLRSLEEAGFAPEDIDVVINSHLHFDHCGWNTVRQGDRIMATFPRATYYAQEGEWREGRLQRERDAVSYLGENYDPLIESGQMKLLNGAAEIAPGIRAEIFPGHTRHMQAIILESGGKTACYISDLVPTAWHLDLVWMMAYDLFPLETIESKKRFYKRAIPGQWLVLFTHDPQTPWAYLEETAPGKVSARGLPAAQ